MAEIHSCPEDECGFETTDNLEMMYHMRDFHEMKISLTFHDRDNGKTIKKIDIDEGLYCWKCKEVHIYQPCPECKERKWSINYHMEETFNRWKKAYFNILRELNKKQDINKYQMQKMRDIFKEVFKKSFDDILTESFIAGIHYKECCCKCTKKWIKKYDMDVR